MLNVLSVTDEKNMNIVYFRFNLMFRGLNISFKRFLILHISKSFKNTHKQLQSESIQSTNTLKYSKTLATTCTNDNKVKTKVKVTRTFVSNHKSKVVIFYPKEG